MELEGKKHGWSWRRIVVYSFIAVLAVAAGWKTYWDRVDRIAFQKLSKELSDSQDRMREQSSRETRERTRKIMEMR